MTNSNQPEQAKQRCDMCGNVDVPDPVIGCKRCGWDEMQPLPAQPEQASGHVAVLREILCNEYADDESVGMVFTAERAAIEAAIAALTTKGEGRMVGAERVAQLTAHRVCCGTEHDPANGKLHGYCVVCGVPWPCEYAGTPTPPTDNDVWTCPNGHAWKKWVELTGCPACKLTQPTDDKSAGKVEVTDTALDAIRRMASTHTNAEILAALAATTGDNHA